MVIEFPKRIVTIDDRRNNAIVHLLNTTVEEFSYLGYNVEDSLDEMVEFFDYILALSSGEVEQL